MVPSNLPAQLVSKANLQNDAVPAGIVKKDLNTWGPRLGVVYNATDRTVVRSGFGVYYDNLNFNELQFTRLVPPFYGMYSLQPNLASGPLLADKLFPDLNNIPEFPAPFSIDPNNRTAYIVQWNVNVQRSLGNNDLVEIAYTGSESRNEHKRFNINQARPGITPIQTRVPYPAFQWAILYSSDAGHAEFRAVSVRLEKRDSGGLWLNANYQLARNRDNGSGEIEANDTAYAWDLDADYGYARYDQRHRSAFSFGYELPFGPGKRWVSSGPMAHALGGWQVQGVVSLASGFPFSVSSTNVCQCGNFVPNRANLVTPGNYGELDNPTPTRWFDTTAYAVPAPARKAMRGATRSARREPSW